MRTKTLFLVVALFMILSMTFLSAEDFGYNLIRPEAFNNNTAFVNSTGAWITPSLGRLTDVNSAQLDNIDGTLTIDESHIELIGNDWWLRRDGTNSPTANINWGGFGINNLGSLDMVGDIDMDSNIIDNIFQLSAVDGSAIAFGNNPIYNSFSGLDQAIVISTNQSLAAGGITHVFLDTFNNRVMAAWQSGKNDSGQYTRNSGGYFPDLGITNASILTNIEQMWFNFGISPLADYFSAQNRTAVAALYAVETQKIIFHDDIGQGEFLGEGRFQMVLREGEHFNIREGGLHIIDELIKEFGFPLGANITIFFEDFETATLDKFTLITSGKGLDEWAVDADMTGDCPTVAESFICVHAGPTGGSADTIIQTNFTTTDLSLNNISFFINTLDMSSGGDFEITMNNNIGSGDVSIYSTVIDVFDQQIVTSIPASMDNQTKVTMEFIFSSSHPIRGDTWIDLIIINATTTISSLQNISVQEGRIDFGNQDCFISQEVINEDLNQEINITCDFINIVGDTTFVNVEEQSLNVTGSIELNGTIITDWAGVVNSPLFPEYFLTNGSSVMQGPANIGGFNLTNVSYGLFDFVGIGTSSPEAQFHVEGVGGAFFQTTVNTNSIVRINKPTINDLSAINFRIADSTRWGMGMPSIDVVGNGQDFFIGTTLSGLNPAIWIDGGTSNIGIGTSSPFNDLAGGTSDYSGTGLHIKGASTTRVIIEGTAPTIEFVDTNFANVNERIMSLASNSGETTFASKNQDLTINVDNILVMEHASGNIGIGLTDPAQKLEIGSNDGTDRISIYHDNTNANIEWDDGNLKIKTVESGVTTLIQIFDETNPVLQLRQTNDEVIWQIAVDSFRALMAGANNAIALSMQSSGDIPIEMFRFSSEGSTSELQISGFGTGSGSRKQLEIGVEVDADDTASFDGVSNYFFDGNVGIGTSSPSITLTVKPIVDNTQVVRFENAAGSERGGFFVSTSSNGQMNLKDSSATQTVKIAAAGDSFLNGGNVGIGTISPVHKLDVNGTGRFREELRVDSGGLKFNFNTVDTDWKTSSYPVIFSTSNAGGSYPFQDNGNLVLQGRSGSSVGDIVFATGNTGTTRMVIDFDGNVGIGTTNPTGVLHLNSSGDTRLIIEGALNQDSSLALKGDRNWQIQNDGDASIGTADFLHIRDDNAGVNRMTFDTSGRVGIGTSSPQAGLHYVGTNGVVLFDSTTADMANTQMRLGNSHYDKSEEPFYYWIGQSGSTFNILDIGGGSALGNAATTLRFRTASNSTTPTGTVRMAITSVGNVGIGTVSPSTKLEVIGDITLNEASNPSVVFEQTNNNKTARLTAGSGVFTFDLQTEGYDGAFRDSNNDFIIRFDETTRNIAIGTDSSPDARLEIINISDTDYFMISTNSSNDGDIFIIDGTGNVGIGTTTPDFKLQVNGSIVPEENATYDLGKVNLAWDNVYAVTYNDLTPAWTQEDGSALEAIMNIKNDGDEIDHLSYAERLRTKHFTFQTEEERTREIITGYELVNTTIRNCQNQTVLVEQITQEESCEWQQDGDWGYVCETVDVSNQIPSQSCVDNFNDVCSYDEIIINETETGRFQRTCESVNTPICETIYQEVCEDVTTTRNITQYANESYMETVRKETSVDESLSESQQKDFVANTLNISLAEVEESEVVYTRDLGGTLTMIIEAIKELFGINEVQDDRLEELESENNKIKDCYNVSKDFAETQSCINGT